MPTLKRLSLALLSLAALLATAAGGALALLAWRPDVAKGPAERALTARLGLPVTIAGPLDLDLGRVVALEAGGVRLAAPGWAADPVLAAVDRLRVSLDLGAWLRGEGLVLPEVRLEGPRVALERDARGRASWAALAGDGGDDETAAGSTLPRIGDLSIAGGKVAYRDAAAGVALEADIATAAAPAGGGEDDPGGLTLDGRGEVLGDALTFALRAGSPLLLARPGGEGAGGGSFPVDGTLSLAGSEVSLKGGALDPLTLRGLDLAIEATSPDPTKLLALLGRPVAAGVVVPPDLALKARLTRPAAAFELGGLDARWGGSGLAGRLGYDPGGEGRRPGLTGELRGALLDLAALTPVLADGDAAAQDEAGPSLLATHDARLSLAVDLVRLPGDVPELREVAADVLLEGGRLVLDPVRATLPEGRLAGRAEVPDVAADPPAGTVRLEAGGLGLGQFGTFLPPEVARALAGAFTGTLEGTVRGATAGEVLAGSNLALKGRLDGLRYGGLTAAEAPLEARLVDGALTLDPFRLALAGAGRLEGRVMLAGLAGLAGAPTAATPGAAAPGATPLVPEARVDLRVEGLELGPLAGLAPAPAPPVGGAFTGTLAGTLRGIDDAAALLAGSGLTLKGRFEGLRYDGVAAGAAELQAGLDRGRLTLDPLRLELPRGGRVAGRVASGPLDADPPAAEVDLRAEGVELATLLGGEATAGGVAGRVPAATLKGTVAGADLATLLGRSRLALAARAEDLRLPGLGDQLPALALTAELAPPGEGEGKGNGARPLRVTAEGRLAGDAPVRLRVEGGAAGLLAGAGDAAAADAAYPFDLDLLLGGTRATARGSLAPPLDLGRVDAAFTLEGEDPGSLLALFDLPALELPPYRLAGNLAKRGDTYGLAGLEGRVGDSDLAGELSVRLGGPRPLIGGDLRSRLLDLDDLGGLVGADPATGAGETASGEQRAEAGREAGDAQVIPDDRLDPARWNRLDADVRLRADRVRAGTLPLDGFDLGVALQAGRLRVEPLVVSLGEGRLAGRAGLDVRRIPAQAELDLDLTRLPVDRLLSRLAVETGSLGTLSGRARGGAALAGAGLSVAEILATADGELTLLMEGGTINRRLVTALGLDLLRLLGGALGFQPEQLEIRCALADLVAKDGILSTRSLAVDTPAGVVGGEGTLDLRTERLDLALLARPQGGARPGGLGGTGIKVTGTLAQPDIAIDPAALLARGAAAATLGVLLRPLGAIASTLGGGRGAPPAVGQGCAELLKAGPAAAGR